MAKKKKAKKPAKKARSKPAAKKAAAKRSSAKVVRLKPKMASKKNGTKSAMPSPSKKPFGQAGKALDGVLHQENW